MHDELKTPAKTPGEAYERLLEVVRVLRRECPWDREQDHHSLRVCMIEEAYEVAEAIDREDPANLEEELGDVLLQAVFHSLLAAEEGNFDTAAPINGVCEKMIRRHPHVFLDSRTKAVDKVPEKWENIKDREHRGQPLAERLADVPNALPALIRAAKVQKRARQGGYTEGEGAGSWRQVMAITQEIIDGDVSPADMRQLIGDLLFAVTAAAVNEGTEPERALELATERFIGRATESEPVCGEKTPR